jgi:HSP20 family protein
MAIVRWDPFHELEDLQRRFENYFGTTPLAKSEWQPAVDIVETPESYNIHAELPDVKKEDVKLTLNNGVLMMSGERRQEKEEKGKKFHRIERSYGRFERSFTLPNAIDDKKISATYTNGVLSIMVPKAPATTPATHEIKIG